MNRFKKFLNKKRVENHFKHSGEGVRLSGESSSSSPKPAATDRAAAADIAAQAALKRMQKNEPTKDASKRRIEMIAKRELEEERRKNEEQAPVERKSSNQEEKELDHSTAIARVLYTSELLGEDHIRSKQDLLEDIKQFLLEQISDSDDENDKIIAAVLMIYSLNKTQPKDTAIDIIGKYCQNILEHPGEEKYKSIRVGNKAFQEKVAPVVGGRTFLEAVGFTERTDNGEQFLTFTRATDTHLVEALGALRDGQAVPIKVARNLELFKLKEGQKPKAPKLTDDFYNLSTAELKAEQKNKELQVEKMLALRTKEMRLKDDQVSNYRYKYTLIRVRLPGNILMQGVFGCQEPFSAVRVFVASALSSALVASEFSLRDAAGQRVDDEGASLAQLSLAPAALLHLVFAENVADDVDIVAKEFADKICELE